MGKHTKEMKQLTADLKYRCCRCKQVKEFIFFYKRKSKLGHRSECKECRSKYAVDKNFNRKNHLRMLYGITIEEYQGILQKQNNKCAICGCPPEFSAKGSLAVDHCHKTNKIRGLLCGECNLGLGKFKDRQDLLSKAIEYLA